MSNRHRVAGRHFLQIPGPTPVPDRILRAISYPTIDHRGPEFEKLGRSVLLAGIKSIFKTASPVIIYPASGTGAWEAALVNLLSPGDKVLMFETGHFATLWKNMATKLGLEPEFIASDWRSGADPDAIEARLREDKAHAIKAVCVVHNETSTGCVSPVDAVRKAIDAARHPALLLVDTISSLASIDYRHDEWGVDVTVAGSQKGLMLPPGLSFTAVSEKALEGRRKGEAAAPLLRLARDADARTRKASSPTRRAPICSTACRKRSRCCTKKGSTTSSRATTGTPKRRVAPCAPGASRSGARSARHYSSSLTAVLMPEGHSADRLREAALAHFDISLGTGLDQARRQGVPHRPSRRHQ